MDYGEVVAYVKEFLRGDNTKAEVLPTHFNMAIMEIATLCVPMSLKVEYTGTEVDVFRVLPEEEVEVDEFESKMLTYYIKNPSVPTPFVETNSVPIDQQLSMALIFYICSYLSNKYTDRFESKAKRTINVYVSNQI